MTITTTTSRGQRQCGAANFRCAGCEQATAAPLDQCPKCGSNEIVPSTCRRTLRDGVTRCHQHGGRAAQVVTAATVRATETKMEAVLEKYGVGPCINAPQALRNLAGEAVAFKDLAGDRLATLRAEDWRWEGRTGEQTRAEVLIYEKAIERAAKILADITRLDLDTRIVQIAEAQAGAWGDVLEVALRVLPAEQAQMVRREFGRLLRSKALVAVPKERAPFEDADRAPVEAKAVEVVQSEPTVPNGTVATDAEPEGTSIAPPADLLAESVEVFAPSPSVLPQERSEPVEATEPTEVPSGPSPGAVEFQDARSLDQIFPNGRRGR